MEAAEEPRPWGGCLGAQTEAAAILDLVTTADSPLSVHRGLWLWIQRVGVALSTTGLPIWILPAANLACLEVLWQELVSDPRLLASSCPPGSPRFPTHSHQLLRPVQWPGHVLPGPGRTARDRGLGRRMSGSGGMCILAVRPWLWNE